MEETHSLVMDLGRYIEVVFRQWRLIASVTLICAIVAGLVSLLLPKNYQAQALVASTKVSSVVSFGSDIKTITEEQLMASGPGAYGLFNADARLQSYVEQVSNPAVAQVVLDQLGDRLAEDESTVPKLLKMVKGDVAPKSDSIQIVVTYQDPVLAADIANAWAQAYVEQVNSVYSVDSSSGSYQAIQRQAAEAKTAYDTAQTALVEFIAHNQTDELNRLIAEQQKIIDSLSEARGTAVNTIIDSQTQAQLQVIKDYYDAQAQNQLLALNRDQQGRRDLIAAYIDALNKSRQAVFNEQVQDLMTRFSKDYDELRRLDNLTQDAQDMRAQVNKGGEGAAASNALALTLLKAQVFSANGDLTNLIVQTNPAVMAADAMLADLDGLIKTLQSRRTQVDQEIQTLSDQLLSGDNFQNLNAPLDSTGQLADAVQQRYPELFQTGALAALSLNTVEQGNPLADEANSRAQALLQLKGLEGVLSFDLNNTPIEQKILELEQKVRDLQAQLAQVSDQQQELTRARDLAWETYKNLATKQAEVGVATQTKGTEVALAAPAAVPDKDTISVATNVVVALVVGLMLGIFFAFFIEFWWNYRGQPSRPIGLRDLFPRRKKKATPPAASKA